MTLDEFLLARVAEDEADAKAAVLSDLATWHYQPDGEVVYVSATDYDVHVTCDTEGITPAVEDTVGPHIARHDPARVLAECAAKRAIVELSRWGLEHNRDLGDDCCGSFDPDHNAGIDAGDVLRHLAAVYADHPDYDEAWRP